MNASKLLDRVLWGMNVAARVIGVPTDAYRPSGEADPIAPENRFLRLHTVFGGIDGNFRRSPLWGDAFWYGTFDAAYTQSGDYLVRDDGTWFVASQQALLPVLCVKTNRVVSFSRTAPQPALGVNSYGGTTAANLVPLLSRWPAHVSGGGLGGKPSASLASDVASPHWTVLFPALAGTVLKAGDIMLDDNARSAIVADAERSDLGWRLIVKQATT